MFENLKYLTSYQVSVGSIKKAVAKLQRFITFIFYCQKGKGNKAIKQNKSCEVLLPVYLTR